MNQKKPNPVTKSSNTQTNTYTYPTFNMILFETSTSVFELMWDIALALFIIRISFVYFLLSFLTGCIIAYFRIKELQPICTSFSPLI